METGHKKEFLDMIQRKGERVFDSLSDVVQNPERDLRKGQIVSFTNKYGVTFKNLEILGFCEPWDSRCVYLDKSSYWFPARPEELTVQEKHNLLTHHQMRSKRNSHSKPMKTDGKDCWQISG